MTNIKIRVATESDAPVLARFRYELRSSATEVIESEAEFSERCTRWIMARLQMGSSWRCWIAEYEQTIVGISGVSLSRRFQTPRLKLSATST